MESMYSRGKNIAIMESADDVRRVNFETQSARPKECLCIHIKLWLIEWVGGMDDRLLH